MHLRPVRTARRTATAAVAAAVLTASGAALLSAPAARAAGPAVAVEQGSTPSTRPFPDDRFTVADPAQATGRRVALPTAGCEASGSCADLALLNRLDGFDVRPRVTVPFTGPIDLASITAATVYVEDRQGVRTGLTQLVQDPSTGDVAGLPVDQLAPATAHTLVVTTGVRAADGSAIASGSRSTFTTMTTTSVLDRARASLDDGSAYAAAGIASSGRTVAFDTADDGSRSVFPASTSSTSIERIDQVQTGATATATAVTRPVTNTAKTYAYYGFGSFSSPQYLGADVTIPSVPTTQSPTARSAARLGVAMVSPAPSDTCIRPVVFGHGFGGTKFDLFLAADTLGTSNLAVFSTDVVGHGFGPESRYRVTTGATTATPTVTTGRTFGRGRDLDGSGTIDGTEGVLAAGSLGSRDALIQTVVDQMALVRALQKGVDVDGNGTVDTCTGDGAVGYYGQSFGGIYGTMLLGTDPLVRNGVPNVAGGPVTEVTRLGFFRPLLGATLGALRNGGPGLAGFTESLPLRRDPRVSDPVQGALPLQDALGRSTWLDRSGGPEAYAPRLGRTGTFKDKHVIFQVAYGDGTVPNPTSAELLRAGDLYDKTWVYRNDRTPNAGNDPHAFLTKLDLPAHFEGQEQIRRFLATDGADERDPDTPDKPGWEPAVAHAGSTPTADYRVQLDCLHYPDPQTGSPQTRTSPSPDCADRSATVAPARPAQSSGLVLLPASQRVLDTRTGAQATGLRTVDLRGALSDPAADSVVLNITVTRAQGRGYVVAFPAGAPVPPTSNLNVEAMVRGVRANTQANEAVVKLSQARAVDLFVSTTADVVVDVIGYTTSRPGSASAPTPGLLEPLAPSRVLDTRRTATPRRTGDVVLDLTGTPAAGATAVVLNVTVAQPDARGYLVAHPSGTARPATSNVNVEKGQTQANEVVVRVGSDGKVVLSLQGASAAVVADLVGVVRRPAPPGGYTALPVPVRAGDSRTGLGLPKGRVRGPVTLTLPDAVPAGATGVLLDVTATAGTAAGYVTVYPAGSAVPETSNVNFPAGLTQANEVLSRVGAGRAVVLDVEGTRNASAALVVDVVGYTTAPAS